MARSTSFVCVIFTANTRIDLPLDSDRLLDVGREQNDRYDTIQPMRSSLLSYSSYFSLVHSSSISPCFLFLFLLFGHLIRPVVSHLILHSSFFYNVCLSFSSTVRHPISMISKSVLFLPLETVVEILYVQNVFVSCLL